MGYSKIDLAYAYYQVKVAENNQHRTAFQFRWGLYKYKVLLFGLVKAPAIFQQLMDHILVDKFHIFATVYLDDILVFLKNEQDHSKHSCWVLSKLREHKLKAKCKKSAFSLAELQYLGLIVKNSTISMDP